MASMNHEEQQPVVKMTAMQGSLGEESYAQNSSAQNYSFHMVAKSRLAIALDHLVHNILRAPTVTDTGSWTKPRRPAIAIADLGCAYGRNTLDYAEFVLGTLQRHWLSGKDDAKHGGAHKQEDSASPEEMQGNLEEGKVSCDEEMEIQYFFSDLPSNDFNALFQSLQAYSHQSCNGVCTDEDHRALPKIFAAGVPGSCYGRLFPSSSLHLVICSFTLHWLSQVPPSVFNRSSLAWNGGHTWINKASANVEHAYVQQSKLDMKIFLKCRAHEMVPGGVVFVFTAGRAPKQDCLSSHLDYIPIGSTWEIIDFAFKEMVDEGLLSLEEMEKFNVPLYFIDQQDFECVLLDIPEFKVMHMETLQNVAVFQEQKDRRHAIQQWAGFTSSIMRPLLEAQLGKYKANEVLQRMTIIASKLDCFNTKITHNLFIACLQRQA